jgi:WS/DGAT/MGAT family acyltransferase
MAYAHYDRLSGADAIYLEVESPNAPMHLGSVRIFEGGPVSRSDGGLDFERIRAFAEAQLRESARFRQKIAYVPGFKHPVWVDDPSFSAAYHLRHTALPEPGDVRRLKRLAGRILSQPLDRDKPLWEFWFVEQVEGGRFALVTKLHSCMAHGPSGVDLLNLLVGPNPDYAAGPSVRWTPRRPPSRTRLLLEETARRLVPPLPRRGGGDRSERREARALAREALATLAETASSVLRPVTETPFNLEVGPHRRLDWTRVEPEHVREVRRHTGGTLNHAALAVASGAVRRFLRQRGVRVDDLEFRARVPVSLPGDEERRTSANRVASPLATLPVDEPDPWKRLRRITATMRKLECSAATRGGEVLGSLAERLPSGLRARLARRAARSHAANLVVTSVPGPPVPVYLLGARMLEDYPVAPLAPSHALGIALSSYDGGLHWSLNSDWEAMPDLHSFVEAVQTELERLRKGEGVAAAPARGGAEASSPTSARPE